MMKQYLEQKLNEFIEEYQRKEGRGVFFRTALIGFADVNDPVIRTLRETTFADHSMPGDHLKDAAAVLSYFLAYSREVGDSNTGVEGNYTSKLWAEAYDYADRITAAIRPFLISEIEKMGYTAVEPRGISMNETELKSAWSHRHMAYAAGLGSFGINNMLITEAGCCGRYDSLVTNLPVETGSPVTGEYCLYKRDGSCAVCVRNCFSGALTVDGFDRFRCYDTCLRNLPLYGQDVCGKCTTGIPCAYKIP